MICYKLKRSNQSVKEQTAKEQFARSRTVRRRRLGDGGRKRFIQRSVFEILRRLDYKQCLLDQCFCYPEGQRAFPSSGSLEELSATVATCTV